MIQGIAFNYLHLFYVNNFPSCFQGKRARVLRALQLSVALIPRSLREEIKRLLTFMKLAAEDDVFTLNDKVRQNATRVASYLE